MYAKQCNKKILYMLEKGFKNYLRLQSEAKLILSNLVLCKTLSNRTLTLNLPIYGMPGCVANR